MGLRHRIAPSRRKGGESLLAYLGMPFPKRAHLLPELLLLERRQSIGGQQRTERAKTTQLRNLTQQQRPHVESADTPRQAIPASLDPQS